MLLLVQLMEVALSVALRLSVCLPVSLSLLSTVKNERSHEVDIWFTGLRPVVRLVEVSKVKMCNVSVCISVTGLST